MKNEVTQLQIFSKPYVIDLSIRGSAPMDARRLLVKSIVEALNPVLDMSARFYHCDSNIFSIANALSRRISLRELPQTELGLEIRTRRYREGWTLAEFARKTGLELTSLSKIEKGHRIPGRKSLERIARVLEKASSAHSK